LTSTDAQDNPRRLGLRARVTLAFALGGLALSAFLVVLTYELSRSYLLDQREGSALRQTYVNARLVSSELRTFEPDLPALLASLETAAGSDPVVWRNGTWFAASVGVDRNALPLALRETVVAGTPARQRFTLDDSARLGVGVPLPGRRAAYFEVFSLAELERTLDVLRNSLLVAGLITTLAAAAAGRLVTRRVLHPVAAVAAASGSIASGELDVRLNVGRDPDLAPLAESFNRMTDALQERIQRDERFAAAVSHELRSPLTTLAASVEVLVARRHELSESGVEAVDLLAAEVRRFERLVQDLLEISRLDAGESELAFDDVRFGEFVLHAVDAAEAGDVPIEIEAHLLDAVVRADKRRLERVIVNLIENACAHGLGVSRILVEGGDGHVRLVVEDAGPGVPPEDRSRIFERFVRGRAAGRRGAGTGTGLGLSLVAEYVRQHRGRVWVDDGPDGGARFVVELPKAEP
jgi:signal transduction histidine kinase